MTDDPPLVMAAKAGDLDRVAELLAADPELVNVRGWMGITPLIAATWEADSVAVVRFLLENGADPLAARTYGDAALHWAASGPVAELLAAAAGPAGLDVRYLFDQTPLHIAADRGHTDVVRAFLAVGADAAAVDKRGNTPLDLADNPQVALLLASVGGPQWTGTPLHDASRRSTGDPEWLTVVEVLLRRGADPNLRDAFGALPSDLMGEPRDLPVAEAATYPQEALAIHPDGTAAVTALFSGNVLVRWQLTPSIEPVEMIRMGRRKPAWGLYGGLAFGDQDTVWLREWTELHQTREIPPGLLPDDLYPHPILSPDGRHLLLTSCECLRLIDLDAGTVTSDLEGGFGDWSVVPRFSPDGRTVAVGNSMQGTWWLTVLDVAGGILTRRYQRTDGLPTTGGPEIVTDVAFTPDGSTFATWVRPDHGADHGAGGLVATTWTESGEHAWHLGFDGSRGALCFTPDGRWLAVGQDSGVVWLDAATGAPAGHDQTIGRVNALAAHPAIGVLAATAHGLRRVDPADRVPTASGPAASGPRNPA